MPAMIQPCPACGRKGIMKKTTGLCVRCSNNSTPAQIVKEPPKPAVVPVERAAKSSAPVRSGRCVGGRFVR